ncbi:hypothetical protein ANN_26642 [Periplaneta americana]|uniref:Uncharacterized protein n=1 Tax=Periplaneta americana TaxID=6978 RepID=A0ABQ8RYT2_PERAM|nr:hypothetical protein ANN_26642 [Periplaneta americana]
MAGLCEGSNEHLAGNEFQSFGRAIVKEDEYEEVRWDGIVSIVSWRDRVFRLWWEESSMKAQVSIILGYAIERQLSKRHGGWKSNTVAEVLKLWFRYGDHRRANNAARLALRVRSWFLYDVHPWLQRYASAFIALD